MNYRGKELVKYTYTVRISIIFKGEDEVANVFSMCIAIEVKKPL